MHGLRALVIGGGAGIGAAISAGIAAAGADVDGSWFCGSRRPGTRASE
jgi:NAD(P)-dependent dehydrogenase (short-subunit alcohol dehydrogenase family)